MYEPEKFGGLAVETFVNTVNAEIGGNHYRMSPGGNYCLHSHEFFKTFDFDHNGQLSRIANLKRDVRKLDDELGYSEARQKRCFCVPWLKKYNKEWIFPVPCNGRCLN